MNFLSKTYFDTPLLVLWGDPLSEGDRSPRFSFGFRDGRPRFFVNTGVSGKENRETMILFPADVPIMTSCMLMLTDIANGPNDTKFVNESIGNVWDDGKPTKEKKVRASLIAGKTKEGMVYITVIAEGFPKIIFPFKTSDYTAFRNANKELIPAADISVKLALAYSEQVRLLISQCILLHAKEEYESGARKIGIVADREEGGGGNNRNGNNVKSKNTGFDDLGDLSL